MATQFTDAQVKAKFLEYVAKVVKDTSQSNLTKEESCRQVAMQIMAGICGETQKLPQMILAPLPHKADKEFLIGAGAKNYWPENHEIVKTIKGTISGPLSFELAHKLKFD
jgi:hypothetical protein